MSAHTPEPAPHERSEPSQAPQPQVKSDRELLIYLFVLIRQNGKWWLLPFLFVLGFLGLFVKLTGNTSLLPAIYALF